MDDLSGRVDDLEPIFSELEVVGNRIYHSIFVDGSGETGVFGRNEKARQSDVGFFRPIPVDGFAVIPAVDLIDIVGLDFEILT